MGGEGLGVSSLCLTGLVPYYGHYPQNPINRYPQRSEEAEEVESDDAAR